MNYPNWLNHAVLYQIFPPSFKDSNGDGIGDLNGITEKLDYIAGLGFNTLWLSPIYDSPFRDAGYDVRDYCKVAARYGTMKDLEHLVAETHARGMRILLDFVPGHTSDEHPWFQQSCQHQANPFSQRYIWSDRTFYADGQFKSPGQFINGYAERSGNYMANFFYFQPALNYGYADPDPKQKWQLPTDHPDVVALKQEMFRIMRFWLDKGIDGFRVDMASSLVKGFDADAIQTAMTAFWQEVREWWDRDYPEALLLAEWSDPGKAVACGFHLDFMIHFGEANGMKPFRGENNLTIIPRDDVSYFDRKGSGEMNAFWQEFHQHRRSMVSGGFLSVPSGNHDLPRYTVGRDAQDLKVIQTLLMTLPHVPTFYYGDEIGMRNQCHLPSKEGAYDRTGARTPMQWDDSLHAGFSTADAADLYLPLDPDPDRPNVAAQNGEADSLLEHLKLLSKLRKAHPAMGASGSIEVIECEGIYPLIYLREHQGEKLLVLLNPLSKALDVSFTLSGKPGPILLGEPDLRSAEDDRYHLRLPAIQSAIITWHATH